MGGKLIREISDWELYESSDIIDVFIQRIEQEKFPVGTCKFHGENVPLTDHFRDYGYSCAFCTIERTQQLIDLLREQVNGFASNPTEESDRFDYRHKIVNGRCSYCKVPAQNNEVHCKPCLDLGRRFIDDYYIRQAHVNQI